MPHANTHVEVLAVVLSYRGAHATDLSVLLWRRGIDPDQGKWSLPGGLIGATENLDHTITGQLADKVDLHHISYLEQLAVFSDPLRSGDAAHRSIAVTYLGLVPADATPTLPDDTHWVGLSVLADDDCAFDHGDIIDLARSRLRAKLSYTNIGFALAPQQFPVSALRDIYCAAAGYPIDATNLLRILSRRGVVAATGTVGPTGPAGGRPPALYRFTERSLRVTDEFATLRPPP